MPKPKLKRHHNCAVDDCQIGLPVDVLMCRPHWRTVPRHLRGDVTRTWRRARTLSEARPVTDEARREVVRDYLAARGAALSYANGVAAR